MSQSRVQTVRAEQSPTDGLTLGDADPTIANLEQVHLDGTLVLIGCGKAKRDPEDPGDLSAAVVGPDEQVRGELGPSGPAWEARDLYTSAYFEAKREFAETVTRWTGDAKTGWAILSAEHGVVEPWQPLTWYDKSVEDIGSDPANPDHRVTNPFGRRRPDGREVVTEMDQWASKVASCLMRWVSSYRDQDAKPWEYNPNTLLVLAGQKYLEPLHERGVFEYGISRMTGDVNQFRSFPFDTRYLFENIDAGGNGEQMAWLQDAISRLPVTDYDESEQAECGQWTGEARSCDQCGTPAEKTSLLSISGGVYCPDCQPEQCSRCGDWTHETGIGAYPLCPGCQTDSGGQIQEPVEDDDEQITLPDSLSGRTEDKSP